LAGAALAAAATVGGSALAGAFAPDDAAQNAIQETIVLVDANGDMAAAGDAAKFDLQRHALEAAPAARDAAFQLAAYGGDGCGGFARLDRDRGVGAALLDVTPTGRRNLGAALDAAVAAFPASEGRKRILAIVGGPNQCLAALCAHADSLKARMPELVVDVIAFGLPDEQARRFDCVAANTGGRFTRADANGLATALALALASPTDVLNGTPPPAALAPTAEPVAEPPPMAKSLSALTGPELFFPRGLRLMASLSDGAAPLPSGVKFELLSRGADGVLRLAARTDRTASPLFAVPAGAYVARITVGALTRTFTVKAPYEGIVNRRVSLDAGQVALSATVAGRVVNRGANFRIERLDAPAEPITIEGRGRVLTTLPAGRYRATAVIDGVAAARTVVAVAPGEIVDAVVAASLGFLRVALSADAEGFRVLRDGEEVARGGADGGLFRLPPGDYRIVADRGGAEAAATVVDSGLVEAALADGASAPMESRRLIAEQPARTAARLNR